MRRVLATLSNCAGGLAAVLLALCSSSAAVAASDSSGPAGSAPTCGPYGVVVYQPDPMSGDEPACAAAPRTAAEIADARAYVTETARPGYTMNLQGMELAIGRLHPEFVVRLAHAIREARNAGLPFAAVFSAYRPPAFGVGGFTDKFHSLHTYGLAVDLRGIGNPGSPEARLWHEIASRNGVVCPYGPRDRAEWNHCQPTSLKIVLADNPLRDTVSADGPLDLDNMFEAGNDVIESMESAAASLARAEPVTVHILEASAKAPEKGAQVELNRRTGRSLRGSRVTARSARHARTKIGARASSGRTPIIAVEERRRISKSGPG
jgi:hypothetical protein